MGFSIMALFPITVSAGRARARASPKSVGMERGNQVRTLLDQDRVAGKPGQHVHRSPLHRTSDAPDDGRADEDSLEFAWRRPLLKVLSGIDLHHARIDLPAVTVAFHGNIHQAQALLAGMRHFPGHEDGAGAGAEHRLAAAELGQIVKETLVAQQLQHGSALTAGDDESVDLRELRAFADVYGIGAGAFQGCAVRREIALQREHPDLLHYQPRVCISSDSAIFEMSSPGMASPSSRLASSNFSGLL